MDKIIAELRELLQRPGPKHVLTQEGYRIVPDENLKVLLAHVSSQAAALKQCGKALRVSWMLLERFVELDAVDLSSSAAEQEEMDKTITKLKAFLALPAVREAMAGNA